MKFFVPKLPAFNSSESLSPQEKLEDKLGGLPWGLKPEQYPLCRHCGKSQSLLAQLIHTPERLDLGKAGRVLFVFHCMQDPGMCLAWKGGSGGNACFVLEPEELVDALTPMPSDSPPIYDEVCISEWFAYNDAIAAEDTAAFLKGELYAQLPYEIHEQVYFGTKLGSVPRWRQAAWDAPGEGWIFVGQIGCFDDFPQDFYDAEGNFVTPPPGDSAYPDFIFGSSSGIGYIFLRNQSERPEGWFFSQS